MREQKVERVWGSPSTMGSFVLWGELQLSAVHFNFWKWKTLGGGKNHLALCLHGDPAFSKRANFGILQRFPDARERNRNSLWRFSHLVHWNPVGSAFPGSCQTGNFGMSFSAGCRYLSRRSEFGLQLNYKVKALLWCAEMFLDFLVLLMILCQASKLNEL